MSRLLDEQAVVETMCKWLGYRTDAEQYPLRELLSRLPSAQPEVKLIDYRDCANALLKLWMDSILTDGEYHKVIGKLNAHQLEMPYQKEGDQ